MFEPGADDVLAAALDGATADWEAHRSIELIIHPLRVVLEVVDLSLDEVTVGLVAAVVAPLLELAENLADMAVPEDVTPLVMALPIRIGALAEQRLA